MEVGDRPLGQNNYQQNQMQQGQQNYNQQQGFNQQSMNMNMNVNGNIGVDIEKKGDLGKISILFMTVGLLCCGIGAIPGIICAFVAFAKDKHNSTNIAAFVIALIESGIIGIMILSGALSGATKNMNINDMATDAKSRIMLETKEDNGTLIYDNNDIEIYYNGLNSSQDFKFFIKNNSDKDIIVECDQLYLNGYDFTRYMHVKVPSGQKANETITLSKYDMVKNDISASDFKELKGQFTITNANTDANIQTFQFSID